MVVNGLDNIGLEGLEESIGTSLLGGGGLLGGLGLGGDDGLGGVVGRELSGEVGGERRGLGGRRESESLDSTDVGVLGLDGERLGLCEVRRGWGAQRTTGAGL